MITTTWKGICGLFDDLLWWMRDHAVDILFFALLIAFVCLAYLLVVGYTQEREQQIELCQRAFEYTAEQCEFIVRNRVMPR